MIEGVEGKWRTDVLTPEEIRVVTSHADTLSDAEVMKYWQTLATDCTTPESCENIKAVHFYFRTRVVEAFDSLEKTHGLKALTELLKHKDNNG